MYPFTLAVKIICTFPPFNPFIILNPSINLYFIILSSQPQFLWVSLHTACCWYPGLEIPNKLLWQDPCAYCGDMCGHVCHTESTAVVFCCALNPHVQIEGPLKSQLPMQPHDQTKLCSPEYVGRILLKASVANSLLSSFTYISNWKLNSLIICHILRFLPTHPLLHKVIFTSVKCQVLFCPCWQAARWNLMLIALCTRFTTANNGIFIVLPKISHPWVTSASVALTAFMPACVLVS